MITALNRTQGRAANDGGMLPNDLAVLHADPAAQPIIRSCFENTCAESPIDRVEHALRVAAIVVRARRSPSNPNVRATL